jgi:hypothetical protein
VVHSLGLLSPTAHCWAVGCTPTADTAHVVLQGHALQLVIAAASQYRDCWHGLMKSGYYSHQCLSAGSGDLRILPHCQWPQSLQGFRPPQAAAAAGGSGRHSGRSGTCPAAATREEGWKGGCGVWICMYRGGQPQVWHTGCNNTYARRVRQHATPDPAPTPHLVQQEGADVAPRHQSQLAAGPGRVQLLHTGQRHVGVMHRRHQHRGIGAARPGGGGGQEGVRVEGGGGGVEAGNGLQEGHQLGGAA